MRSTKKKSTKKFEVHHVNQLIEADLNTHSTENTVKK